MSEEQPGYERLGAKRLRLVDCISQSVGFMGPVFSAAFLIPLIAGVSASGKGAGIATPLAVLIAAVGTFALGWIVAAYAKRVHAAGSLYDYVSNGLGARAGAFAGWIYYGGTTVLAIRLAAPMLVTMLIVDLVLGLIGRTMPQMNVMSAGLTLRAVVGLVVVILGIALTASVLNNAVTHAMEQARAGWAGRP